MSIILEIPTSVAQALKLPPKQQAQRLFRELALTLYEQEILSFGKARELAGLSKSDFSQLLGQRKIDRHYSQEELEEDLTYANRE